MWCAVQDFSGGASQKLVAEELGGKDYISPEPLPAEIRCAAQTLRNVRGKGAAVRDHIAAGIKQPLSPPQNIFLFAINIPGEVKTPGVFAGGSRPQIVINL